MNATLGAVARVSQVVTEVVVFPTDVSSRVSQVVVEVVWAYPDSYTADAVIYKGWVLAMTADADID